MANDRLMCAKGICCWLLLAAVGTEADVTSGKRVEINVEASIQALLGEEDTNGDRKITIDDLRVPGTARGDELFLLKGLDGKTYTVHGTYHLANLLQELTLEREAGEETGTVRTERIFENPVERFSRMIRQVYWDGLTRRIDAEHLREALPDSKVDRDEVFYLYVPHEDDFAFDYFSEAAAGLEGIELNVERLPGKITPEYVKGLEGRHGLLPLALRKTEAGVEGVPFVVPGGRFNEMYGWDSYFEALGLIADGRADLARAMVDNFVYQIRHYGKILNANRSYYLTRSQPPFLTSMALAVYEATGPSDEARAWLREVMAAAIREYETVWMDANHLTVTGLSRYYGTGIGIPPEVEEGHFDAILRPYARERGLTIEAFRERYEAGAIEARGLDEFFMHDRAVRESGHDTTYRWRVDGEDRAADFVTVDLNALLYKYELDIEFMLRTIFDEEAEAAVWSARAQRRRGLILKYLWDPERKLFFDYYLPGARRSEYISATAFYPLWACCADEPQTRILSEEQAAAFVETALGFLESRGGVLSTAKVSLMKYGEPEAPRQWEYPNGWAPHQMLIWKGLANYGFDTTADRLIYKWLYMITVNAANYGGTIPEKFDVVDRSHAVFAEYGNVGTEFAYMTREGFGWMNASYQVGLERLSDPWRGYLERLVPPEWVGFE